MKYKKLILLPLAGAVELSLAMAFLLRFDFSVPPSELWLLKLGLWVFLFAKISAFYSFRIHCGWWHLAGFSDLTRILLANLAGSLAAGIISRLVIGPSFPKSIYFIDFVLCFLITAGMQFSLRLCKEVQRLRIPGAPTRKSILIYGAGAAGLALVKEIRSNQKLATKVVGFLDDDPAKLNRLLAGVPILGTGRSAARLVTRFQRRQKPISEIVIAMPSANSRQMRTAIANCRASGVSCKTVPSTAELLDGKVLSRQIRDVSVKDLLGRDPVHIDESKIGLAIRNQSVMVTGGCGSIGSELCRQLARFEPKELVIFDQAESDSFMLSLELRRQYPSLNLIVEIGDIYRANRVEEVVQLHSVSVIFHAAAYKHVPLMETNIIEAVENNVIGTYNVARAAHKFGVQHFILISSDKAVNPTSIMGVTKRITELIVSAMPLDSSPGSGTFVSVRFGNVLASAGSVVQIFQRQIAAGGPVTVTHPDMRRYFMSIPEAVQLVLQASTMGKGSEVFVLDMGEPVPVVELARNMIRLAGFTPDEDIEIRFTGLRPGEKLFEELRLDEESIVPTYHEKIKIFRSPCLGRFYLLDWLDTLQILLQKRDAEKIKEHLLVLVPEYCGQSPLLPAKQKHARHEYRYSNALSALDTDRLAVHGSRS